MKTALTFSFFISIVCMLLTDASAQNATKEKDLHEKLSQHHQKAAEHAKAISDGMVTSKADQQKKAEELDQSLQAAKKTAGELKTEHKGKHEATHKAIETHHKEAATHVSALKEELKKPNPDNAKVKSHAEKTHVAIQKAEEEHKKTR